MIWKTRSGVLTAALAIVLVACGGDSAPSTTTSPPSTTVSTTTISPSTTGAATTIAPDTTVAPTTTMPEPFPVVVTASNGDVVIPARPVRIVSLSATHTEMIYAIGAGDQVVAVDMFSDFPPGTPTTDLTGFTPNVEALVDMETDLVILDGDWDGTSVGALTDLGIPVLVLEAAVVFDDVYEQITALGAATGHGEEAADLVETMQTEIASILDGIEPRDEPATFYHELDTTYFSVTSGTFIGQVYTAMGLVNIADAVGDGALYTQLSEEFIIEQDPDLIFLADTICCGVDAPSVADRPGWASLTAVQRGAVVELSDDVASRWGPRIVEHIRTVADALSLIADEP